MDQEREIPEEVEGGGEEQREEQPHEGDHCMKITLWMINIINYWIIVIIFDGNTEQVAHVS